MTENSCSKKSCLWSESSSFCEALQKASVPHDDKWPVLILCLRSVGENPQLSNMQKNELQGVLVSLLKNRSFTKAAYQNTLDKIQHILSAPYEKKLSEITREAEALAKEVSLLFGKQKEQVDAFSCKMETEIAEGVPPTQILAGIRTSLKQLASQMEKDTQALTNLSHTDCLTALANRRALDQFLAESVHLWKTQQVPVAAIIIDVDKFKLCNDTYGHIAGDEVLRSIGKCLNWVVRIIEGDNTVAMAARYGGEEFMVVIRGAQAEAASFVAEQIRLLIAATPTYPGRALGNPSHAPISATVSIGIAHLWEGWQGAFETNLVESADKALLAAKQQGRNRSIVFDPKENGYTPVEQATMLVYEM